MASGAVFGQLLVGHKLLQARRSALSVATPTSRVFRLVVFAVLTGTALTVGDRVPTVIAGLLPQPLLVSLFMGRIHCATQNVGKPAYKNRDYIDRFKIGHTSKHRRIAGKGSFLVNIRILYQNTKRGRRTGGRKKRVCVQRGPRDGRECRRTQLRLPPRAPLLFLETQRDCG